MLVLSRKQNERLVIDGNIVVTIVRVSNNSVRIGIEAPPEVLVRREELLSRPRRDETGASRGRVNELAACSD